MSINNIQLDELHSLVNDILVEAQNQGCSAAEVMCHANTGFSLNSRKAQLETLEHHNDRGIDVVVYFGQSKGTASTTDMAPDAIKQAVTAACYIAKFTEKDPFIGLADKVLMANQPQDLQLHLPPQLDIQQAIDLVIDCEQQAMAYDKRIVNSEGVHYSSVESYYVYGNTHGFIGAYPTSRYSFMCQLIAEHEGRMQQDSAYSFVRDPSALMDTKALAELAGKRTVGHLGARRIKTCKVPVIFRADLARGLLRHFCQSISGDLLARKATFLVDSLGQKIFPEFISLRERPHIPKALASAAFDGEGVATHDRTLVEDGILQGYILDSYNARKLDMQTTANAGGIHNLQVTTQFDDLEALLREMGTGIYVTDIMGQGINLVNGNYSRGIGGFWVENGEIQYPIEEVTIAGNLKEMFANIVGIANDIDYQGGIHTGSLLLAEMSVAGE